MTGGNEHLPPVLAEVVNQFNADLLAGATRAEQAEALLPYEFEPECSITDCRFRAAWTAECVYECGNDGFMCQSHHDFISIDTQATYCSTCKNSGPAQRMYVFRPIDGAS